MNGESEQFHIGTQVLGILCWSAFFGKGWRFEIRHGGLDGWWGRLLRRESGCPFRRTDYTGVSWNRCQFEEFDARGSRPTARLRLRGAGVASWLRPSFVTVGLRKSFTSITGC